MGHYVSDASWSRTVHGLTRQKVAVPRNDPSVSWFTRSFIQSLPGFLSGYTAKVAGTERGVTEPQATFSACFGAAFMSLSPGVYARLLGEKIAAHRVNVWLVNTGWSGGPYGVGHRMSIDHTRAVVHAALAGVLNDVPTQADPIFGLAVPTTCPHVPPDILDPRSTWSDTQAYDNRARQLAARFAENFKSFANSVSDEVRAAGPRVT